MHSNKKLKIAYLCAPEPVDAEKVYVSWQEKRQPAYFGTSYLSQYYDLCAQMGAEGYVITILPGHHKRISRDNFVIENRPIPSNVSGLNYHFAIGVWQLRLLWKLVRYKPDVLIVSGFQNYWFLLSPLKWLGVSIIASIHCTLWPKFAQLRLSWRVLLWANKLFFFRSLKAIMAVSQDIGDQVDSLLDGQRAPVSVFVPTYDRTQFANISPASRLDAPPFRVLFAGRIETNKGVYHLLEIARKLRDSGRNEFEFDICGEGSQLDALRQRARDLGLEETFSCHGFCNASQYRMMLERAYLVIIPTTTDFEEGFNKVCAEAILAGRPIITSAVCPALASVRGAAVEVLPDNVDEYLGAVVKLCDDKQLYSEKCLACVELQEQFYNKANSWGAKLQRILSDGLEGRTGPRILGRLAG